MYFDTWALGYAKVQFQNDLLYSIKKNEIVVIYYKSSNCTRAASRIFNDKHHERHATNEYVIDMMHKFTATVSVCNKKHTDRES